MDLSPYTRALREDLLSAAAVGDESVRRSASVLAGAIEPAARLAIMNALSDLAAEITGQLDGTTVEIRLDGRDLRVAVDNHTAARAEETFDAGTFESGGFESVKESPAASVPGDDPFGRALSEAGGELSRTTVRIFNDLKSQAEEAASSRGESLNAFISRAISDSVRGGERGRSRRTAARGNSVNGFIQS